MENSHVQLSFYYVFEEQQHRMAAAGEILNEKQAQIVLKSGGKLKIHLTIVGYEL